MNVASTAAELRPFHGGVFVPTMGALHAGHAALIRHAAAEAAKLRCAVVVSIFVNPTQFNDPADLARYPRTLEADVRLCREHGATAVFAPDRVEVYPADAPPPVPPLPAVGRLPGLEDSRRPGHFAGVCQVVNRLFELVKPAAAVFGEKDWQQLQVITAMVQELRLPIRVIPSPTVREHDGLAMSSRNVFLTPAERPRAAAIHRSLVECRHAPDPASAEQTLHRTITDAGLSVEYAVIRNAATLRAPEPGASRNTLRALVAARLGAVRLIDNAAWTIGAEMSGGYMPPTG